MTPQPRVSLDHLSPQARNPMCLCSANTAITSLHLGAPARSPYQLPSITTHRLRRRHHHLRKSTRPTQGLTALHLLCRESTQDPRCPEQTQRHPPLLTDTEPSTASTTFTWGAFPTASRIIFPLARLRPFLAVSLFPKPASHGNKAPTFALLAAKASAQPNLTSRTAPVPGARTSGVNTAAKPKWQPAARCMRRWSEMANWRSRGLIGIRRVRSENPCGRVTGRDARP